MQRIVKVLLLIQILFSAFRAPLIAMGGHDVDYSYHYEEVVAEAQNYFNNVLHPLSENIYDQPALGTWGEQTYHYKMALRDIYWRVDAYHHLVLPDSDISVLYRRRRDEALAYLKSVQVVDGDTGVWGVPEDFNNPEFGSLLQQIHSMSPEYFSDGFLVKLDGNEISQLYYDHGRTLATFCKVYLDTEDKSLLPYITRGANWILDKPAVDNVNYNSAVIEGLSYAYLVTENPSYLEKAIFMTEEKVFSQANADGSFGDFHNRKPWYHGFIVSGLVRLKQALPLDHELNRQLDQILQLALGYLEDVTAKGSPYAFQWPGINARVWSEVEDLVDMGKWPDLTDSQWDAYANCLYQTVHGKIQPEHYSGFRQQKILYHYIQIGNALGQ